MESLDWSINNEVQQTQRPLQSDWTFIEYVNVCLQTMCINIFAPFMSNHCQMSRSLEDTWFFLKEIISVMARILSVFPAGSRGPPEGCAVLLVSSTQEDLPAEYNPSLPAFPVGLAAPGTLRFLRAGVPRAGLCCPQRRAVPGSTCAAAGREEPVTLRLLLRFPSFCLCPRHRCIFSWPVLLTAFRVLPILLKSLSVKRLSLCSSFLTKWWNFEM